MPSGHPGGTVDLDGFFYDGSGAPTNPVNPLIDILDPNSVVVVNDAVPTLVATGHYSYTFAIPADAELSAAWRIRWSGIIDGLLRQGDETFDVVEAPPVAPSTSAEAWRPTVADVAAIVFQRAGRAADGQAVGTFDATTTPTAEQVENQIRQVQAEVRTRIGDPPESLTTAIDDGGPGSTAAGRVVAVGAASYVELQFYPDNQGGADSPAVQLWERYQALLTGLATAVADLASDEVLGSETRVQSRWAFPDTVAAGIGTSHWERF